MPNVKKTHWFAKKKPQNLNKRPQSYPNTKKENKVDVYGWFFVFLTDPNETTRQFFRECSVRSEIRGKNARIKRKTYLSTLECRISLQGK